MLKSQEQYWQDSTSNLSTPLHMEAHCLDVGTYMPHYASMISIQQHVFVVFCPSQIHPAHGYSTHRVSNFALERAGH